MEQKEPYIEPVLDDLGSVGDVTGGGIFDLGGILDSIFGTNSKPRPGSR